jgi:hypothetical protein
VTNGATPAPPTPPAAERNRKVLHATCALHRGPVGFTNLVVSKRGGSIEFDPHVTGACVLTLAEHEAVALRDALTRWLG